MRYSCGINFLVRLYGRVVDVPTPERLRVERSQLDCCLFYRFAVRNIYLRNLTRKRKSGRIVMHPATQSKYPSVFSRTHTTIIRSLRKR
jgi:hypothetical protein